MAWSRTRDLGLELVRHQSTRYDHYATDEVLLNDIDSNLRYICYSDE